MKSKKSSTNFAIHIWAFLIAIALILACLLLSITVNAEDSNYYTSFQKKNSISQATGKSYDELAVINEDIVSYIRSGQTKLLEKHFNEKEVAHMIDVYGLFNLANNVMNYSFTFILLSLALAIYLKVKNKLFPLIRRHIFIILLIIVCFIILISTDFNKYFTIFHEIFFDNDLWILNPETDLMIQMMPINFFIEMSIKIVVYFIIMLAFIFALISFNQFLAKRNNKECILCSTKEVE